jgi:hypothetical protein
MTAGGSHTNFDTAAFSVGAIGGAATIAGAIGAGWQNYRAACADRWASWTIGQLRAALDCSELMRYGLHCDLNAANQRIADLERQLADIRFVIKRDRARALRAQR